MQIVWKTLSGGGEFLKDFFYSLNYEYYEIDILKIANLAFLLLNS